MKGFLFILIFVSTMAYSQKDSNRISKTIEKPPIVLQESPFMDQQDSIQINLILKQANESLRSKQVLIDSIEMILIARDTKNQQLLNPNTCDELLNILHKLDKIEALLFSINNVNTINTKYIVENDFNYLPFANFIANNYSLYFFMQYLIYDKKMLSCIQNKTELERKIHLLSLIIYYQYNNTSIESNLGLTSFNTITDYLASLISNPKISSQKCLVENLTLLRNKLTHYAEFKK